MSELIKCPECGNQFELSKAMSKDLEASLEKKWQGKLQEAAARAKDEASQEIKQLEASLNESRKVELSLRKERVDLEARAKNLELEVQRKIDEERAGIMEKAAREANEAHRMKDLEKDKKISDALAQVEELKRKMEQGSQQAQGETLEAELEDMLRVEFPHDTIDPVSPGVKGGDILHTVVTKAGVECGRILWEIKRTKTWSEQWIAKVKSDSRNAKADVCFIATEALPKDFLEKGKSFGEYDGVWVSSPKSCLPLIHALRQGLVRAAKEKFVQAGKKDKAILVYEYLTGTEFKGRLEALVECYAVMRSDLDAERRAMEKLWAKREKQIAVVTSSLSGMHGEIEAIAVGELPAIPALQLGVVR